jgi:hypothetical protein
MSDHGVGAQVYAAAWLARTCGLEVESFGRTGLARKDTCLLEMSGKHLAYTVLLDGGWIFIGAQEMDRGDAQVLVTVADGPEGWQTTCRLISTLERSGLRSLVRPFQVGGDSGPGAFVFG